MEQAHTQLIAQLNERILAADNTPLYIKFAETVKNAVRSGVLEHGNILILDEPTNHLDISMKEVIEDAMKTFTGTILFVSHDRYLLDARTLNQEDFAAIAAAVTECAL